MPNSTPTSAADPVWIARRIEPADDREVVAFIAAALAFGRVQSVLNSDRGHAAGDGTLAGGIRARSSIRRAIDAASIISCTAGPTAPISRRWSGSFAR